MWHISKSLAIAVELIKPPLSQWQRLQQSEIRDWGLSRLEKSAIKVL